MSTSPTAFVRAHTRLAPVAYLPELVLHLADEPISLWEDTERAGTGQQPPPFWAFAWAGGQALARYLLDHDVVRGRRVLDIATGSGLVAIAAARMGAAAVTANDVDPLSLASVAVNATANGVQVSCRAGDLLDGDAHADVVLAGDVFYSRAMAARVLPFLRRAVGGGALVLVGDPGRAYLPATGLRRLASYDVPVPAALESTTVRHTTVWQVGVDD